MSHLSLQGKRKQCGRNSVGVCIGANRKGKIVLSHLRSFFFYFYFLKMLRA